MEERFKVCPHDRLPDKLMVECWNAGKEDWPEYYPGSRKGGFRSMSKKPLTVDLPEELSDEFIKIVTEVGGRWRSQRAEETFTSAVESAVIAALMLFLQGLDGKHKLPEFREYARLKYPELNEDMITTIADLIERETVKQKRV